MKRPARLGISGLDRELSSLKRTSLTTPPSVHVAQRFFAELDVDAIAPALHALADGLQLLWLSEPELDMGAPIIAFLQALGASAGPEAGSRDEG